MCVPPKLPLDLKLGHLCIEHTLAKPAHEKSPVRHARRAERGCPTSTNTLFTLCKVLGVAVEPAQRPAISPLADYVERHALRSQKRPVPLANCAHRYRAKSVLPEKYIRESSQLHPAF